ncbi:MAG: hypothetical protein RLZZ618_3973 [Pseudomonadota bacterium]|jgi:diguanylate cyclase (GGDEF)-like protein
MKSAQVIPWPRPTPPGREPAGPVHDTALQASLERAERRRKLWVREGKVIATSYGINGFCLALFAMTGTVSFWAAVLYVLIGWTVCGLVCMAIASGRTSHLKDPSLAVVQSLTGMAICVAGAIMFPQVGIVYLMILFTVFLSATYRMSKTYLNVTWFVVSLCFGTAMLWGDRHFQIPHASFSEQAVAWFCFATTLARCTLLSLVNTGHNKLLSHRGKQMKDTLAKIERLANYDELTNALNRRSLMRLVAEEIDRAERTGHTFSVALFDLDRFKSINDTLGHLIGDRTLRRFADEVHTHQRNTDRFGRYGGEEFLLIMPETPTSEGEQAVERLRECLAGTDWTTVSPTLNVTFSAGLATHQPGETAEQLLARADHGLYGAKDAGRNCLRVG